MCHSSECKGQRRTLEGSILSFHLYEMMLLSFLLLYYVHELPAASQPSVLHSSVGTAMRVAAASGFFIGSRGAHSYLPHLWRWPS